MHDLPFYLLYTVACNIDTGGISCISIYVLSAPSSCSKWSFPTVVSQWTLSTLTGLSHSLWQAFYHGLVLLALVCIVSGYYWHTIIFYIPQMNLIVLCLLLFLWLISLSIIVSILISVDMLCGFFLNPGTRVKEIVHGIGHSLWMHQTQV